MNKEQEKCNCAEMSCKKDCVQNHTHKGFFCEKCEPLASRKMFPNKLIKTEQEKEWEADALWDKEKDTINIIERSSDRETYLLLLEQMYHDRFKLVKVKIKIT